MSELYLMATISDRNQSRRFLAFYKEYGISVTFLTLGRGTAASEVLDAFGLEASEKAVQFAVVTATEWKKVKKGLEQEIKIDIPGTGIAFVTPRSRNIDLDLLFQALFYLFPFRRRHYCKLDGLFRCL